jgi:hypothetical protein
MNEKWPRNKEEIDSGEPYLECPIYPASGQLYLEYAEWEGLFLLPASQPYFENG